MPYPLNNYPTVDTFQTAGTSQFLPAKRSVTMVVTGNMVMYQLAVSSSPADQSLNWGPETQVTPGRYTFDQDDAADAGGITLTGLRVRSAVTGLSANVFIQ